MKLKEKTLVWINFNLRVVMHGNKWIAFTKGSLSLSSLVLFLFCFYRLLGQRTVFLYSLYLQTGWTLVPEVCDQKVLCLLIINVFAPKRGFESLYLPFARLVLVIREILPIQVLVFATRMFFFSFIISYICYRVLFPTLAISFFSISY